MQELIQDNLSTVSRKYTFNHNFFDNITDFNKAYWLGYFIADGTIKKSLDVISINTKLEDEYILYHLSHSLNCYPAKLITRYKLKTKPYTTHCNITFNSRNLVKDLYKLGVYNKKTYNLNSYFYFNNSDLNAAFVLGFFDGDGGVNYSKRDNRYTITFGNVSETLLYSIANILYLDLNIKLNKIEKSTTSGNIIFSRLIYNRDSDILKIYKYFYDKAPYFLIRKKTLLENHINTNILTRRSTEWYNNTLQDIFSY